MAMIVTRVAVFCVLVGTAVGISGPYRSYRPGPPKGSNTLDTIDKLYAKLDDVIEQLKTGSELVDGIESQLSLLKKFVDDLQLITFPGLESTENSQNLTLDKLEEHLDNLMHDLDDLETTIESVEEKNNNNIHDLSGLSSSLSAAKVSDTEQEGEIAILLSLAKDIKDKLFTVFGNELIRFSNTRDHMLLVLDFLKQTDGSRMCETGEVTLNGDDRRAEALFQTCFASTPQLTYSITGFDFDLDNRDHPPPSYHQGYYVPFKEPNSIGVITHAVPSKTGVTFDATDLAFGDTRLRSVTVAYQACSIGPGTELSGAHDVIGTTTTMDPGNPR